MEQTLDTCNNSDGAQGQHVEWKKKTISKGYVLYDFIYVTFKVIKLQRCKKISGAQG